MMTISLKYFDFVSENLSFVISARGAKYYNTHEPQLLLVWRRGQKTYVHSMSVFQICSAFWCYRRFSVFLDVLSATFLWHIYTCLFSFKDAVPRAYLALVKHSQVQRLWSLPISLWLSVYVSVVQSAGTACFVVITESGVILSFNWENKQQLRPIIYPSCCAGGFAADRLCDAAVQCSAGHRSVEVL